MKRFTFLILIILPDLVLSPYQNRAKENTTTNMKHLRMLNLGDSYTIGELVQPEERFPNQTIALLAKKGMIFDAPEIIAVTGWTTDELNAGIDANPPSGKYDVVTLLIGVNNQYRGRSADEYRTQFTGLLNRAIGFSKDGAKHVIVLSIPDWGVTPYAEGRDRQQIAKEIDQFNAINKEETIKHGAGYIDITPISRKAASDASLTASDGLHPSGKMYAEWAELVADKIQTN
jgi:lysophospholipase L1-like esterase